MVTQIYVAFEIFRAEKIFVVSFRVMKPCNLLSCYWLLGKKVLSICGGDTWYRS